MLQINKLSRQQLFWLLIFTVKICVILGSFSVEYTSDSCSYYYPVKIFDGEIHPYRMVIYPLLISFFSSFDLEKSSFYIVVFQHLLSFFSVILFYKNVTYTTNYKPLVYISTFFYVLWKDIYQYDNFVLAESLTVFFTNLLIFNFLKSQQNNKQKYLLYMLFISLLSVLLKPALIYVLFLVTIYVLYKIFSIKAIRWSLLFVLSSAWIIVIMYCYLNKQKNNYYGLSTIGINNSLANVILSNAYKDGDDSDINKFIDSNYQKDSGIYSIVLKLSPNYNPHDYLSSYPKTMLPYVLDHKNVSGFEAPRLKNYITSCFYTKKQFIYTIDRAIRFLRTYKKLSALSSFIMFLFIMRIRNFKRLPVKLVFIFSMIWLNALMIIIWGIEDWERLLLPSFPIIALLYIYFIDLIIRNIEIENAEEKIRNMIISLSNKLN